MHFDLRALGVYRIGIAACVLADLFDRARNLTLYYTDTGALPRLALIDEIGDAWRLSLHLANGTSSGQSILFTAAAISAFLMMVGWKTRLFTLLTWLFTLSVQTRNPLLLQGGDIFLRCILLFSIFLPLGASFSIDRLFRAPSNEAPHTSTDFSSPWTSVFTLQVVLLYFFTGLLKLMHPAWQNGDGAYYAFYTFQFMTSVGVWASGLPWFVQPMNWIIPISEAFLPIGVLLPSRFWKIRTATVASFFALHLGIFLLFEVGLFPWICLSLWCAFIPGQAIDRLAPLFRKRPKRDFTIFYDSDCGICKRIAIYLARLGGVSDARVQSGDFSPSVQNEIERENSWIVERRGPEGVTRLLRFEGVVALLDARPMLRPLTAVLSLRPVCAMGNRLYRWFASHRTGFAALIPQFGADPQQRLTERRPMRASKFLAIAISFWLIAFNFTGLSSLSRHRWWFDQPWAYFVGLDQYWDMFSSPVIEDGWFILRGVLADGTEIDLLQDGKPIDWSTPYSPSSRFDGERERKFLLNLYSKRRENIRRYFVGSHCIRWNKTERNPSALEAMEFFYMKYPTLPARQGKGPVEKVRIWKHECAAGALAKWKIDP